MSESIVALVDKLPTDGITVSVLRSLDFVVPGEWDNVVGFANTVRKVTGESNPNAIQKISERALWLYNDESNGYQKAIWLYQTVDNVDSAIGAAAMANKVSEKISFLGFLNRLTPKPDTIQAVDLCLKVVAELLAFCNINNLPPYSIGDFAQSVSNYSGESLMRMAALVCFDGLVPLGPDFIGTTGSTIHGLSASTLEQNPVFQKISSLIPGDSSNGKLNFIGESFDAVKGWMGDLVTSRGLNPEQIIGNLQGVMDIADDKLDYVAAFLDMTSNYYEHTGIQTVAHRLIERAATEV